MRVWRPIRLGAEVIPTTSEGHTVDLEKAKWFLDLDAMFHQVVEDLLNWYHNHPGDECKVVKIASDSHSYIARPEYQKVQSESASVVSGQVSSVQSEGWGKIAVSVLYLMEQINDKLACIGSALSPIQYPVGTDIAIQSWITPLELAPTRLSKERFPIQGSDRTDMPMQDQETGAWIFAALTAGGIGLAAFA